MNSIITSRFVEDAHVQQDGSRYITERHTDNLGRPLTFGPYLCPPNVNPQVVMELRAERLNAEFAVRAEAEALAARGRIPWSKLEFRDALGTDVEQKLDELFATFESNPAFTIEQKRRIRTGWNRHREAHYIERPLRAEVVEMFALAQALGIMTAEKAAEVIAAAEA